MIIIACLKNKRQKNTSLKEKKKKSLKKKQLYSNFDISINQIIFYYGQCI
tara:strand:- start:1096 stop:1245 length:150 start_codon:yes stop_codon:yes gene_type:complete